MGMIKYGVSKSMVEGNYGEKIAGTKVRQDRNWKE